MNQPKQICFLYANIGRGHPFYLDGIVEQLRDRAPDNLAVATTDVFERSSGLSRLAWRAVRRLYRHCSSSSLGRFWYGRLRRRNDYNRASYGLKLLGRDLESVVGDRTTPLVVAHPILVGTLRDRPGLIYQHGEVVTPAEAVVRGASLVLVPTEDAAEPFLEAGYDKSLVVITGLCIESQLASRAAGDFQQRLKRLNGAEPLTGLFVSSGAEPPPHVAKIVAGVNSAVRAGGCAEILVRHGGRLERAIKAVGCPDNCRVNLFSSRSEEAALSARLVPGADYLVAPPHERTNWALGLGLPMFALTPSIGSFAPLNLARLEESGVGGVVGNLADAVSFGSRLEQRRLSGQLVFMSKEGWGRYEINGFARIAELLLDRCGFD